MAVPRLILIDRPKDTPHGHRSPLCDAWSAAIDEYLSDLPIKSNITILEGSLTDLPIEQVQCDCLVSPANSFGIMDGGYDKALSVAFAHGNHGVHTLTRCCQAALLKRYNGYAPPSSCTIASLPLEVTASKNKWSATTIAIVPTMRQPENMAWHHDLVYNCMYSLLSEVHAWNESFPEQRIHTILMTGLGTGWGKISYAKCAKQMILAIKHFHVGFADADWDNVAPSVREVEATFNL